MKFFIYKFIIIIVGLFFLYQLTIGYTLLKLQQKFFTINFKDKSNSLKNKIREEMNKSLKKDKILSKDDAILLKNFYNKISSEISNLD
jgi:hypothetical protein